MVAESIDTIVIDDQAFFRKSLTESLVRSFPQVRLLGSGDSSSKTLTMIENEHPDLVFF